MYTFDGRVRYSEVDGDGRLTMAALINYFQDCSTFQSEDLGVGIRYLQERNLAWVLCSWQIRVERYPELGEKITVGTAPYDMKGFLGYRNFALLGQEGEFLARANTLWSLLDMQKGRPVPVPEDMLKKYVLEPRLDMEYASRKITAPGERSLREPITVKKHHLDTNHHVNNQQFIGMAMDYLPEDFVVGQVRAEYRRQAFLGDVLVPGVLYNGENYIVVLADTSGAAYMTAEFAEKERL